MYWVEKKVVGDEEARSVFVHVHDDGTFAKCWQIPQGTTVHVRCRNCEAVLKTGDDVRVETEEQRERWYVFSGDFGGQIFLTVPEHLVTTRGPEHLHLLADMDAVTWNEGDSASLELVDDSHTDVHVDDTGRYFAGGMGGSTLLDDAVWVHGHNDLRKISDDVIRSRLGLTADVRIVREDYPT